METNWKVIGQIFENVGAVLKAECEGMGELCEENPEFEKLWLCYVMMLDALRMQRKWIGAQGEIIDVGYTDVVI